MMLEAINVAKEITVDGDGTGYDGKPDGRMFLPPTPSITMNATMFGIHAMLS